MTDAPSPAQEHEALAALAEAFDILGGSPTIAGQVVISPAVIAGWMIKHVKPMNRALAMVSARKDGSSQQGKAND